MSDGVRAGKSGQWDTDVDRWTINRLAATEVERVWLIDFGCSGLNPGCDIYRTHQLLIVLTVSATTPHNTSKQSKGA